MELRKEYRIKVSDEVKEQAGLFRDGLPVRATYLGRAAGPAGRWGDDWVINQVEVVVDRSTVEVLGE